MLEKLKAFYQEHKLDVIEKGAMVLGAVLGVVVVAVSLNMKNAEEPMDDVQIIDITNN